MTPSPFFLNDSISHSPMTDELQFQQLGQPLQSHADIFNNHFASDLLSMPHVTSPLCPIIEPENDTTPIISDFDWDHLDAPLMNVFSSKQRGLFGLDRKQWLMQHAQYLNTAEVKEMIRMLAQNNGQVNCEMGNHFNFDLNGAPNDLLWDIFDFMTQSLKARNVPFNPFVQQDLVADLYSGTDHIGNKRKRDVPLTVTTQNSQPLKRQKKNNKFKIQIEVISGQKENGRFKCNYCAEDFYDKPNFLKHIKIHTKERPHICNICNKTFRHSQTLKEHKNIHANLKPFKCPQCKKGFASSANLKRHVRIHTGVKPYKCKFCPKRFNQSGNCKSHMRRCHAEDLANS